jgi:signal transduction histidine kinase
MGVYDRAVRRTATADLQSAASAIASGWDAHASDDHVWLDGLARDRAVWVRILDRAGNVVYGTDPVYGEGRFSTRRWFEHIEDLYFVSESPPDLGGYEKTLPPLVERPEVQAALGGGDGATTREPDSAKMFVFYDATALPGGQEVAYLSRISRRSVRELYDLRVQLLKLSLVLLVLAVLLAALIGWHIASPLTRMQRAIQLYRAGHKDVRIALDRRGDEIGALSRDFQDLVGQLQERLAHTTEVAADLAHDLKSPLSTVTASAELLHEGPPPDEERRRRIADAIGQAASHMTRSVDAMLALARADEELGHEERVPVVLAELVEGIVAAYRQGPHVEAIHIEVESPARDSLLGNQDKLAQLVRNLLDNALVFARARVLVRVERDASANAMVLTIADDGDGVSPGNREKIFRRFFSSRPEGKPAGTGLGLAMAQAIAQAHGGTVRLADTGPLPGAAFVTRLSLT